MKTLICFCLAAGLALFGTGFVHAGSDETEPTIRVSGPETMDKKAAVVIEGTGFTPGQEINLLFTPKDGMPTDIGYALKGSPKTDDRGTWRTTWSCYDFIRRKMVAAGKSYKIVASDSQYQPLAQAVVTFKK